MGNGGVTPEALEKLLTALSTTRVPDKLLTTKRAHAGETSLQSLIANVNKSDAAPKISPTQTRYDETVTIFNELYDLVYVKESDEVFVKNRGARFSYRPFKHSDGVRLLTKIYKRRYPTTFLNDTVAQSLYRTICNSAEHEVASIDDSLILVGYNSDKEGIRIETLYWDANDGQFIRDIQSRRCFRRLFDNGASGDSPDDDEDNEWRYNLKLSGISQETILKVYNTALAILEHTGGELLPYSQLDDEKKAYFDNSGSTDEGILHLLDYSDSDSPLNAFWTWSNHNIGRTNDLLKAASSVFMKRKPTGAFILVGRRRNGKSTFIDMLTAELGISNTSAVKLTDFDDATHFAGDLATTMLNAPDDDEDGKEDKILKSQGTFKSITAHGMVTVRRLYSSDSIKLHARWVNIFPMNDIPQWQGSSKEACMKRTLCISFNNDLSRNDRASREFAKETFTSDFYSVLIGVQGAIASYYSKHDLKFSDEMEAMREAIKEDIDGEDVFVDKLTRMFSGMTQSCAEKEYKVWSGVNRISYNTKQMKKRLKMALGWESKKSKSTRSTYYNYVTGTSCAYEKFGDSVANDSDIVMADKQMILIKELQSDNISYVDKLVSVEELHRETEIGPENTRKQAQSVIVEIENYILNTEDVESMADYCKLLKERCKEASWA
ncbi:MAG: hypothetical protein Q4F45_07925 [Alistipes sp.]|nr:hypothetical protein [Alistipes sp.]